MVCVPISSVDHHPCTTQGGVALRGKAANDGLVTVYALKKIITLVLKINLLVTSASLSCVENLWITGAGA
jgi:hypothetical protein